MQSSKEQQGEVRKPSSVINEKKQRKTIEWKKLYRSLKKKKIRDTKGTFHAMMGSLKDRNDADLKEAEDIKKGWQEHTEELYKKKKKILKAQITMMLWSLTQRQISGV